MTTIQQLYEAMQALAPLELAESWDNPGLLVDCAGEVTRVLVTLDITPEVVAEAAAKHCEAIVAHHPVIFDPLKKLGPQDVPFQLVRAGISAICMHTNLDAAAGGVNEVLAGIFGMQDPEPFAEGCGRVGSIEPITVPQLACKAQQELAARCNAPDVGPAVQVKFADTGKPVQRLAVKTNLLYDAILMPSLEVEYRIADRWTVNLEGEIAWWKNDGRHKYYQVATISPEGRWWFGQKQGNPWHGHYLGVFGGFTWYDLENGKEGYQGEAEMVGVSYGYMFPIGRRFSLEAGIGVGYMHSKYEEYLPIDGHYVYQQTNRMNYFGPLKLKFALVWRLWDTGKKKGGAR